MNKPSNINKFRAYRTNPVWWIIAVSVAVIALNMTFRDAAFDRQAFAQSVRSSGARGIFAFSGQLSTTTYGIFMVDTDSGTIWCYEIVSDNGVKKLRLVAGRSWLYDKSLEDYNVDGPLPDEVEEMLKRQWANTDNVEGESKP